LNVTAVRGDAVTIPVTIQENGVAINLTGRTFAAQVRRSNDAEIVVELLIDTTNAATGQLVLSTTAVITAAMLGEYVWDLQQTIGSATRTLLAGAWFVRADVTR
jgi:hypothetical protein